MKIIQKPRNFIIPLSDIKVSMAFKATTPNIDKVMRCKQFYLANGYFDRQIILNHDGYIIDGYIAYLVAKKCGVENVPVTQIFVAIKNAPHKAATSRSAKANND